METELRLEGSSREPKIELDVRKILEQMGLDRDRWPDEWKAAAAETLGT